MKGPLSGVRVIDLTQSLAGPFCTMILGDLGAEVVKIEIGEGDMSRLMTGPNHKGMAYYYIACNRNKKSLTLDIGTAAGKEAFFDLVKVSDVVLENFRVGSAVKLGIGYDAVKEINPKIVYCSISGFGLTGPMMRRPCFDHNALALSGIFSITGEVGQKPVKPGPPVADMTAGIYASTGIIAALFNRDHIEGPQKVETCLLDGCLSLMATFFSRYFCGGEPSGPQGSGQLSDASSGVFATKTSYIALGACWPRIARVVGAEWMIEHPKFKERAARLENKEELQAILQKHLLEAEAEDWLALMEVEDIPATEVLSVDRVAIHPQVLNNNMVVSMEHHLGGEVKAIGNPIKMPGSLVQEYSAPPVLGQHNQEILVGLLGYSAEKIKRLEEQTKEHSRQLEDQVHKKI